MADERDRRGSAGRLVHDRATRVLSTAMMAIGVAFVVRAVDGAGVYAVVLGVLFLAAGAGRLYAQLRTGRR